MDENEIPDEAGRLAGCAVPQPIDMLIELWWADYFPGSPVAQLTPAWNQALAAKEDLKRRLASFAGGVA
ncbi:MAG: hypothetical protein AB7H90_11440 [Alphaproteobacteria bacterium]